jgi:alpha/beta superfamily hydrolase
MELNVTFRSENQQIFGNLHLPYENAACIITLHGLESSKDSGKWPIIASRLYDEGYACLRFNFRGCGEGPEKSEGKFEDTNLTARIKDYKSALQFLQDTERVDLGRLGVIGSSFGGMVAIAAEDKRIKAMVTLSTPYIIRLSRPSEEVGFYKDLQKYDLLKAIRSTPPVLVIHGSSDEVVPLEHSQQLHEAAIKPKRLEIIGGANHVFSQSEHLNEVINLSLGWFKKYL